MYRAQRTDPSLWTRRPVFGVAGGPDEIVLSDEGLARAWSVGAGVRRGGPAEALEALATAGGSGALSTVTGARLHRTALGRFDQLAWGRLRAQGYVESWQDEHHHDGVRLTTAGRNAVERGRAERISLLERCRLAAMEE